VHIHQRAVENELGGENRIQIFAQMVRERGGAEGGAEKGNAVSIGDLDHLPRRFVAVGKDDAGKVKSQHPLDGLQPFGFKQRIQIADLCVAHDLNAPVGEQFHKTAQGQARTIQLPLLDFTVETDLAVDDLQGCFFAIILKELFNRDGGDR